MSDTCMVSSCDNEWPHLHIMPIEELMSLDTCEIDSGEWHAAIVDGELTSYLDIKRDEIYDVLKESILNHGFQPGFAPEIDSRAFIGAYNIITEGHHRITVMYDISGRWCPWQDTTNYDQWDANWKHYVHRRSEEAWNTLTSSV